MGGVLVSPIVGIAHEGLWSQVLALKHFRLGVLVIMLTLQGEDEQQVREQGQEFLKRVEDRWEEAQQNPEFRFDLKELLKTIAEGATVEVEVMSWWCMNDEILLMGKGMGQAILKRGDKVGVIFKGIGAEWQEVSGRFEPGDRWLVGTSGLMGSMSRGLLDEVLQVDTVSEAAETLSTRVQSAGVSAAVAGAVIYGEMPEVEVPLSVSAQPKHTIYLRGSNKKRKTAVSVGLLLLLLLGLSVFLGSRQRQQARLEDIFAAAQVMVVTAETQARGIAASNPAQAGVLIEQAQAQLTEAITLLAKRADLVDQLNAERDRLQTVYQQVTGEATIYNLDQWLGLAVVREGLVGSRIELLDGTLFILDQERGLLVRVLTENKKADLVAGGEFVKNARFLGGLATRLALLHPTGVVEVNPATNTTGVLVRADEGWDQVMAANLFAGNVYTVDVGNAMIWRYPGQTSGVGEKQSWLAAGSQVAVSQFVDMAIDGDIWLLLDKAQVLKLRRGAVESWKRGSVSPELTSAIAIDTKADDEQVYVFDQAFGRVVAFVKETGIYHQQYKWEGLKGVVDVAVDEKGGFIYALSGASVFRMSL